MLVPYDLSAEERDVFLQIVEALERAKVEVAQSDGTLIIALTSSLLVLRKAGTSPARTEVAAEMKKIIVGSARAEATEIAKALRLPRESLGRLLWVQ